MGARSLLVVIGAGALVASCFNPRPYRTGGPDGGAGGDSSTPPGDAGEDSIDAMDGGIANDAGDAANRGAVVGGPDAPDDRLIVEAGDDHPSGGLDADGGGEDVPEVGVGPTGKIGVATDGGDTPPVASDAGDASDGDAVDAGDASNGGDVDPGDCHSHVTEPPKIVSLNGRPFTVSDAVRAGLVLWLDSTNLGPVNSSVSIWCDQSGQQNDAYAIRDNDPLPMVIAGGGVLLPYGQQGGGLIVGDSPSLDLASDDFLVLVVAGFSHGQVFKTFFRKSNDSFTFPKQVILDWINLDTLGFRFSGHVDEATAVFDQPTPPGTERLYGLRRVGDQIQVRVNGTTISSDQVPVSTPGESITNAANLYLGASGDADDNTIDQLRAVVVVHGTLSDPDVGHLEGQLITTYNLL